MRKLFSAIAAFALVEPYSVSVLKHYRPLRFNLYACQSCLEHARKSNPRRRPLRGVWLILRAVTFACVAHSTVTIAQDTSVPSKALVEQGDAAAKLGHFPEAFALFGKAADQGDATAQFQIGAMYAAGRGVEKNCEKGISWLNKSASQGYAWGQAALATKYLNGDCTSQDYAQAMDWYRKAADQGLAVAQFQLAFMYRAHLGTPQDYTEALRWLRKASDQGFGPAQFYLGAMYSTGEGVTPDQNAALTFLKSVADRELIPSGQGSPGEADVINPLITQANSMVAAMYDFGLGIPKDPAQALRSYQKAAALGDAKAKERLAQLQSAAKAKAEMINLTCESETLGGVPLKSFVSIDSASKYVRVEIPEGAWLYEYRDGAVGKVIKAGYMLKNMPNPDVKQFVSIDQNLVRYGYRNGDSTSEITIDRNGGVIRYNGKKPHQCQQRVRF
jgi:TPR repeat protein